MSEAGEITTQDRLADGLDNIAEMVANLSAENERLKASSGYHVIGDPSELFAALAKAQAEFPPIERTKTVTVQTKSGGSYTFDYAPLDQIRKICSPILGKHGIAVSQPFADGEPYAVTTIMAGHGARIEARVTIAKAEDIKAQGGSITYICRYSYCAMVGVSAETDDDGNMASGDQRTVRDRQPRQQQQAKPQEKPPEKKAEAPKTEPAHMTQEQSTKIALLKTALKLSKDEMDAACKMATGKPTPRTSTDLSKEEADKLIVHLEKLRAAIEGKSNGKPEEKPSPAATDEPMSGVQFNAIGSLVSDMDLTAEEVNAMAMEILGKPSPKVRTDWTFNEAEVFYTELVKRKEGGNVNAG